MRNENDDRLGQNLGISPLEEWDSGDWKEENVLFHETFPFIIVGRVACSRGDSF